MRFPLSLSFDLTVTSWSSASGVKKNSPWSPCSAHPPVQSVLPGVRPYPGIPGHPGTGADLASALEAVEDCARRCVTITGGEPCSIRRSLSCWPNWCTAASTFTLHQCHIIRKIPAPPAPFRPVDPEPPRGRPRPPTTGCCGGKGCSSWPSRPLRPPRPRASGVHNTTIYKETDVQEIEILFSYLGHIGVDGLLVSPAFSFAGVDDAMFLSGRISMPGLAV